MTILFIMIIIIAKPKQDGPTSLPIKSFAEIAQTNPYLTGQAKP